MASAKFDIPEETMVDTDIPASEGISEQTGREQTISEVISEKERSASRWYIELIRSMRPHQWVKNAFVFAGLVFSQKLFNLVDLTVAVEAFIIFCLLSGSVYVINDILDIQEDRQHPEKRDRPLASGRLRLPVAVAGVVTFIAVSLTGAFVLNPMFGVIASVYFLQNLLYSKFLKHIVLLDVMLIGIGFVLRAVAGAVVINVEISSWLILCTFLLALFLGFNKRRHELILLEENANNHRRILDEYSPHFLDMMTAIVTAATVISYALYTMSSETINKFHTEKLIFTTPFVIYGIFRYLYLVYQKEDGGDPTKIALTDRSLQINILLWLMTAGAILYLEV